MRARLTAGDLVLPLFVCSGTRRREPVSGFPGVFRRSVDRLVADLGPMVRDGVSRVLLFGVPDGKTADGRGAWDPKGPVPLAVRALRRAWPRLTVITDVCLCAYTDHGHCGVFSAGKKTGRPVPDGTMTRAALAAAALAHAAAGADWVAPSAMCRGQVRAIRAALDRAGHARVQVLSYSAKFASSLYGPFRAAALSAPAFGDRRGYQLDPADAAAALRCVRQDEAQGAAMVMVKPALMYLDIVRAAAATASVPVAAYVVSGEYALIEQGAAAGVVERRALLMETMTALKRAGAGWIISYHARDMARWLSGRRGRAA